MIKIIGNQGNRTEGKVVLESFADAKKRWEKEDNDKKAITAFKSSIHTEQEHDAIMRNMYGSYGQYVAQQLEENTSLSDSAKANLISYYGITDSDTIRKNTNVKQGTAVNSSSKASAFQNLVKGVNNGTVKVAANISDEAVTQWGSSVTDVSKRAVEYLKKEGYKQPDTNLAKEIDDYISQSADVAQYMRANKLRYQDYDKAYEGYVETTNYLRYLKRAVDSENEKFSSFKTEGEYNDAVKVRELYDMSSEEILPYLDTSESDAKIRELKKKEEALLSQMPRPGSKGKAAFVRIQLQNERREVRRQIEQLTNASRIAYTTTGGQNITWQSLYDKKKQEEEFNALYNEKSAMPDWEEKAKYASTKKSTQKAYGKEYGVYADPKYEYINGNMDSMTEYLLENPDERGPDYAYKHYDQLTEDELKLYNYLYAEDKKNGTNSAEGFLTSMEKTLKSRAEGDIIESVIAFTEDHPIVASLFSLLTNIASGAEWVGDLVTGDDSNLSAKISSTIRGTVADNVDWDVGDWDVFDFLYGTGMSLADSTVAMVTFGGLGGVTLGLSAAAQSTNDALNRGMSKGQAFTSGLAAGIFEGLFESWSIGEFRNLTKSLKKTDFINLSKYIGKNMWNNAKEELLTEVANIAYDTAINGEFSQAETSIRQLMANGVSESDAKKQVAANLGLQVAEAAGSGALMGFGFGSAGAVSTAFKAIAKGKENQSKTEKTGALAQEDSLDIAVPLTNEQRSLLSTVSTETLNTVLGENAGNITLANLGVTDTAMQQSFVELGLADAEGNVNRQALISEVKLRNNFTNIDGQTTTGYNNNTNINQDKGGIHSGKESLDNRGHSQGDRQRSQTNAEAESEERRIRPENEEDFVRRVTGASQKSPRKIRRLGNTLFAYTPSEADGSEASRAVGYLKRAGIDAIYCEGSTESNKNGNTIEHNQATTSTDGKTFVSSNATLSAVQIAAHEAVHVKMYENAVEYTEYESVICDGLLWGTDEYAAVAKEIFEGYHRSKYEKENGHTLTDEEVDDIIRSPEYAPDFLIEFTAYVNEAISANSTETIEMFSKVFSNWDAVVEASRNFNEAIGLDFSDADTAAESSSTDSQSTDSDSETVPTGGRVLEMPAITVKQQNFVKKIGKALGRNVEFVNMEKFLKEHDVDTEKLKIYPDGAIDGEGNIYIWYNAEKPVQFLFKHELTHFSERSKYYKRFVEFVRGTKIYEKWMREKVKTSESYKEWLKKNPQEVGKELRITQVEGFLKQDHINAQSKIKENFGQDDALAEVIADFVGENCFGESLKGLEALIDEANLKQHPKAIQYLIDFFAYLKKKLSGNNQITFELSRIEDSFRRLISDANNTKTSDTNDGGLRYSFDGYAEDGKGKYKSNFPKGTPKSAKADVILRYIQNVWSKKPIRLKIEEGGKVKYIEAQFDPTYDETGHEYSDATKLMGGNRHGTAAEQRVTLDLADDYYQIASESRYNYSKDETGKDNLAHKDVVKWHYFVNDIYFAEYDSTDYSPYRVSINVKEKADGNFVYSFSAEKQESDTPQTLHAVVNEGNNSNANVQLSNNKVTQDAPVVKNNSMQENENYSSEKKDFKFSVATESDTEADTESTDFTAEFNELMKSFQNGEISQDEYMQRMSELYQRAIKENGQIKPGEKVSAENKDFPVPKSVKDGTKVRQHTRRILESGRATEEQESFFKEIILAGKLSYTPTSNKKNIKNAEKAIEKEGYEKARENWSKNIANWAADANTVAKGEALLQLAFEQKNTVDIVNIAAQLAELGTYIGQGLQAMSLVKRMGGLGQLVYLERCVARINDSLKKRIEKGKAQTVTIDPTLAQQLAESKTEAEFEITYAAIVKDIAAQVPSTFADKWNALRYVCMLLNPVTHIRNMTGNGVFFPAVRIKDLFAVGLEKGVSKDKRTKVVKVKKAYQEFAEKDFAEVKDIITGTGKYNPSDEIRHNQRIFKSKLLEAARKFNFDMLEKEDVLFLKMHYKHALGGYLQAQGVDLSNISIQQLTKAREYAMQEALKATYRDASKAANMISHFAKTNAFTEIIVEGLIPYKKTPINIIKRGVEYSPIGLIKTLSKGIYDLNQGNISTTQFIDGLACGLTGTGVCILGMFLASLGIVKGGFDDEEKWFRKLNGEQEYSIQIGNFSYTIDWATPASIPLFLGVAIAEYDAEEDEDILSSIWNFGTASFEPLLNLSLLSGLEDAIVAVSYADDGEKITSFLGTTMESYFAQFLPTVFGKTANLFDDTRRTNYIDRTSNIPVVIQEAWNKIAGKIPIASQTRAEYVDAWGETQYTGNFIQRFFQQFVSPGYASTVNVTDVSDELMRLYRQTGVSGIFPSTPQKYLKIRGVRRDLSKEEYFDYATFKGQTQADLVNEAIHSKEYTKLTDEQKTEVIKDIYSYAGALAKCQLDYSYEEIASMEGEDKKGNLILTKEKYNRLNDKARQMLIDEYFMESSGNVKAYKTAKNGKSVVEYFCKKVKE